MLQKQRSSTLGLRQIVSQNSMLASIIGISGNNSGSLETEIKILESPSVLKPVYNYVLEQKYGSGEIADNYKFSDWLPNLKIELEAGTTILNISYQDTDKELVLPIITRVSQTYQEYSGRDRSRGLSKGVIYLENNSDLSKSKPTSRCGRLKPLLSPTDLEFKMGCQLQSKQAQMQGQLKQTARLSKIQLMLFSSN